jgi:hypothetical protein
MDGSQRGAAHSAPPMCVPARTLGLRETPGRITPRGRLPRAAWRGLATKAPQQAMRARAGSA